jgi:hypothetical protein
MPHVINFDGPKTSSAVITSAELNGAFGQAHNTLDNAVKRLGHAKDEFHLNGAGYETRWKKFVNTTKTFAEASACVGVATATGPMLLVDLVTGRGTVRPDGEKNSFMDEGVLGNGGRFLTALGSGATEIVGAGVGGLGALVTYPAKGAAKKSSAEWFEGGASGGAQAGGKIGAHLLGGTVGVALDVVRIPSVLAKVTLGGVCGLAGGAIGALAGGFRAMIDQ